MPPKKSRALSQKKTSPFSLDELLRMEYECPKASRPAAMRSFAGWNGIVFDQPSEHEKYRVGFQRLPTGRNVAAWMLSANARYRVGLPLLSTKILTPKRGRSAAKNLEPLHHAWNARHYYPLAAAFTEKIARTPKGKRAILTDALDALIFGTDDRKPYWPSGYPWTCVGRLEDGNGTPLGSGALVGRDLVLTARHVILDAPGAAIKFVPGYYNGTSTVDPTFFSWAIGSTYYSGSGAGAWDFAVVRLYQPLGDFVGYFGVRAFDDDWEDLQVWAAAGYPSMSPFNNQVPSYLIGVSIDDEDDDGDAAELDSEDQDNSKGNSGGPLWAVWPDGPYIVATTSANHKTDYGPFGDSLYVMNAGGQAMVDLIGLERLKIDTSLHASDPTVTLSG